MSYINQVWEFLKNVWTFAADVHFTHLASAWFVLLALVLIGLWRRKQQAVAHTAVTGKHKTSKVALRVLTGAFLLASSWAVLSLARAEPKRATVTTVNKYQAREFVFSLDRSGSMAGWDVDAPELAQAVDAWEKHMYDDLVQWRSKFPLLYTKAPEPPTPRPAGTKASMIQRFSAGLYISYHVLESRPADSTDRYAFFTFDDRGYWLEPLGRDRLLVMDSIPEISRKGGGGTNFDGPREGVTDKGAVQETIDHFRKLGQAKTRVMVFVSDGDAGIDPKRHEQFVEQMRKKEGQKDGQDVHIFFLLAGPMSNFTGNTADSMKKLVKAVNPDTPEFQDAVLWVGDGKGMAAALEKINRLEKSLIESDPVSQEQDVRHEFILAAGLLMVAFIIVCTVFQENY